MCFSYILPLPSPPALYYLRNTVPSVLYLITLIKVKSNLRWRAFSACDYHWSHPEIYMAIASLR